MKKYFINHDLSNFLIYNYQEKKIIVKEGNFVQVPSALQIKISENSYQFCYTNKKEKGLLINFLSSLSNLVNDQEKKVYTKRISINGLGYKVFKESPNKLRFHIGYSIPKFLNVPEFISRIGILKRMLIVQSSNKMILGNFVANIIRLRKRDIYKGKGLSLDYNNKRLKAIKKK